MQEARTQLSSEVIPMDLNGHLKATRSSTTFVDTFQVHILSQTSGMKRRSGRSWQST